MRARAHASLRIAVAMMAALAQSAGAQGVDAVLRDGFPYRNLGPFRSGAFISGLAVPDAPASAHRYTIYVAVRNGGVWKTTNNGTTWAPIFDSTGVWSMGQIAIAPSNERVVYVGTGDASETRSAYFGNGVYRSDDAGGTWRHLGLADTHRIARVVVHPTNPDIVWVAAMGHLFSGNVERGVFKSSDGGRTWRKTLYIDEHTGASDLMLDPRDPNVVYAAMYEVRRFPWVLDDGGPGTGIYKSADGGETWTRLAGGLPTGKIGRIGLALVRASPDIVYAILEDRRPRGPTAAETRRDSSFGIAPQPRPIGGQLWRSDDAGRSWRQMSSDSIDLSNKSGYAFNQIAVHPTDADRVFVTGSEVASTEDGGRTWHRGEAPGGAWAFRSAFGDHRALWIDPDDPRRMMSAHDGGLSISYDGGRTNDQLTNLPLGEVYAVAVDMEQPYRIYAGLQDHESWRGPSNGINGSIALEDWVAVGEGDGMHNQVDPSDSRWVYNTREFGQHRRYDQVLHAITPIAPTRTKGAPPLRFNWVAPIRLSPHDAKTLYAGAQVLFRSRDRGDHWTEISPDLTTNDPAKISLPGGTIQHCTITTIAESPLARGEIWVGTDDGKVQLTRDGGAHWNDATASLVRAGAPADAWVTRVTPSPTRAGVAYVSKSRHRMDDFRALVYRTTDYGATWTAIASDLPARTVNVIIEDPRRAGLLYAGADGGVYASLDDGTHWSPLRGNMPPAPVHDLVIHPREGDLVVATYGRGLFVTDVTPVRELSARVAAEPLHLFAIRPRGRRREGEIGNFHMFGDRFTVTPNEPNALVITYALAAASADSARITIANARGEMVRTLVGAAGIGMHRVAWAFTDASDREVAPGEYVVTVRVANTSRSVRAHVLAPVGPDRSR